MATAATASIRRILLVRTDRLGDVVLTLPMLPVLRRCCPDASIAMLLRRYTGAIMEGHPQVDTLLWYDENGELVPFLRMCRILRRHRFDAAIVVYPTIRLAWLMFCSGIPLRVGTGYRFYSVLFNRRVYEHRKDARRHEVEYNLNLLGALGCAAPGRPEFPLVLPDGIESRVREILRQEGIDPDADLVLLHPGSGGSAREWSAESFGLLGARLAGDPSVRVAVTGTASEAEKVGRVIRASDGRAVSLAGRLTLAELAGLIRHSRVFVANSTGPVHLAAAVGTPVVGLYPWQTPMSAGRWGPYTEKKAVFTPQHPGDCTACDGTSPCACMQTITVDEVFRAASSFITEGRIAAAERRGA